MIAAIVRRLRRAPGSVRLDLGGEDGAVFVRPCNLKRRVIPQDGSFMLGSPKIGGFVENFRRVGKDHETVGETGRDPEHFAIGCAQRFCHPFAESGRTAPEIDRDVVDFSAQTADELSLRLLDLVMQTAYHVPVRERLIVLNERTHNAHFRQSPLVVAFEKVPRLSSKTLGSSKLYIRNRGRYRLHLLALVGSMFKMSARDLHPSQNLMQLLLPRGEPETESVGKLVVRKH